MDLEFKTPEKQEKEEEPTEELIKPGYVREVKEIPEDETDATELTIPKVKVSINPLLHNNPFEISFV